ncbi:MAG: hypothetical protein AB7H70_01770 [Rhodospirillaceae bacterium]
MDGGILAPPATDLAGLADLCGAVPAYCSEAGKNYVFFPKLRISVKGKVREMDALLCLNHSNASYPTRLYLAEKMEGNGLNWNESTVILGRTWHTWSWSGVGSKQTVGAILASHLKALT